MLFNGDSVSSLRFDPTGRYLLVGDRDGKLTLWDTSSDACPECSAPFPSVIAEFGDQDDVVALAFSADGQTAMSGSSDGSVVLWDMSNPRAPRRRGAFREETGQAIRSILPMGDGALLVGAWYDRNMPNGTAVVWDVSHADAPIELSRFPAIGLALIADQRLVLAGGEDSRATLWDISTPQSPTQVAQLDVGEKLALSADGKLLAAASGNQIALWDLSDPATPTLLSRFTAHSEVFVGDSMTLSQDGHLLAFDLFETVVLWDISTPTSPYRLGEYNTGDYVTSLSFSADGKALAIGGTFSDILWNLDVNAWRSILCERAGRNLTQAEWRQYLGDEPYRKTCEEWPEGE
jgi:WD40 repeat protein